MEKNLALKGIASQSSIYGTNSAQRAIDGNAGGNLHMNSCTYTGFDNNPWWMVTFKKKILVDEVIIANRADCCGK